MSSIPQPQLNPVASPRTVRAVRKIQSLQTLPSVSSTDFNHSTSGNNNVNNNNNHNAHGHGIRPIARAPATPTGDTSRARQAGPSATRRRARSSSVPRMQDVNAYQAHRRPARRSGIGGKKSALETYFRDGPFNGNLLGGLQELRYLVLSTRVDADADGMVCLTFVCLVSVCSAKDEKLMRRVSYHKSSYRVYLWLALLDIPAFPTDEYLALVHRGRSPAYGKIRNDTFRTLATDPLFKRRVTEASLIRLLNAVAWKLHDAKNSHSSGATQKLDSPTSQRRAKDVASRTPEKIAEDGVLETDDPVPNSPTTPDLSECAMYVQGMNVLCAPFLYAARSEVEAFALFHYFITRECPGYVRGAMDGVHKGLRLVDRCLEIVEPKLASYLFEKGMQAELYAFPSVLTLCASTPPLPEVLHLWDFLFSYGPHLNILCIVAQLIQMRDTILQSPRYISPLPIVNKVI